MTGCSGCRQPDRLIRVGVLGCEGGGDGARPIVREGVVDTRSTQSIESAAMVSNRHLLTVKPVFKKRANPVARM